MSSDSVLNQLANVLNTGGVTGEVTDRSWVELQRAAGRLSRSIQAPGTTYSPVMRFLWNGVPFEELGIADIINTASFGTTVGRTKASKRFKSGKPKVGGAEINLLTPDPTLQLRLKELLEVKTRPVISVASGYEDGVVYWIGTFRINTVTWTYPAAGVVSVALHGQTSKYMGMVQKMKPRVYTNTSIRRILKGIADEHDIILDIDPVLSAMDVPIGQLFKTAHESDWDFISRISEYAGAGGLYMPIGGKTDPSLLAPAATFGNNPTAVNDRVSGLRTNEIHILRIQQYPGFVNLGKVEFSRLLNICVGHFATIEQKEAADVLVTSAKIEEEGAYAGLVVTPSKKKDNDNIDFPVVLIGEAASLVATGFGLLSDILTSSKEVKEGGRQAALTYRDSGDLPGSSIYQMAIEGLPASVAAGNIDSERMMAIALQHQFTFTLNLELNPAVVGLQAGEMFRLTGTPCHDGIWGVETATLKYSGAGLRLSLSCKVAVPTVKGHKKTTPKKNGNDNFPVATVATDATRDITPPHLLLSTILTTAKSKVQNVVSRISRDDGEEVPK